MQSPQQDVRHIYGSSCWHNSLLTWDDIMNTNLYLYCALNDLDGGCDGANGEGEAGDGTVSDCRILFIVLLSSSNHLHTILVYSAYLLHITLISYQMWVVVVEWKWK